MGFVLFMFYVNAAYVGACWPHPAICEYICGQRFGTIYMHLGTSCSTSSLVRSSRNLACHSAILTRYHPTWEPPTASHAGLPPPAWSPRAPHPLRIARGRRPLTLPGRLSPVLTETSGLPSREAAPSSSVGGRRRRSWSVTAWGDCRVTWKGKKKIKNREVGRFGGATPNSRPGRGRAVPLTCRPPPQPSNGTDACARQSAKPMAL